MLLVGAGALTWSPSPARAAPQDPVSVGDRFETLNLAPGFDLRGWDVRPAASLRGGYDDNITWSPRNAEASSELELRGSIDASQRMGRFTVDANALLKQTYYPDSPDNARTDANVGMRLAFELEPNLVLRGAVSYAEGVETGITNGIIVNGIFDPYKKLPTVRRVPLEAGVDYRIGRFTLRSDARLEAVDYDPQTTQSGVKIAQDFQNGWQGELRLRGGYEVLPHLSFFTEVVGDKRRYEDSHGDSDSWRAVTGGEVEFSHLLIGEAYVGYAVQSFPTGGETSGLTYGAGLHWFAREILSFTLDARREFRAEVTTTTLGATSTVPVTFDQVSVRAEWEPTRPLLVYAQAGYQREGRDSVDRTDELTSFIVGATYILTRDLRVVFDYEHQDGTSNFSGDFERNRVSLGLAGAY